ncbi:MAG: VPEID-CTERM sorting domain-containing protein [Gammaproteobacteria bacterium]|nr:VPEID-CTERM sorting domain-containing protein [Gammaproteobacteria bacterium]
MQYRRVICALMLAAAMSSGWIISASAEVSARNNDNNASTQQKHTKKPWHHRKHHRDKEWKKEIKAPEIDVSGGERALAVLVGVLLLVAERSRRSSVDKSKSNCV